MISHAVHTKGPHGLIPIQTGIVNPNERAPRYYFGSTDGATHVSIPSDYPRSMGGTLCWIPEPPMFGGDGIQRLLRLSDPLVGKDLEFTFGWSVDGRFWVLFGLDPLNKPEDVRKMSEFPRMLRALAEGDTLVGGNDPSHKNRASLAYSDMRRAYNLQSE